MSKSMWIDALIIKPVKANQSNTISIEILFWVEGKSTPLWGHFDYYYGQWYDGHIDQYIPESVKYFAYIDNPYK